MERREDIRAAMQSLLSPARRTETLHSIEPIQAEQPISTTCTPIDIDFSDAQTRMLNTLQSELRRQGIRAEVPEIAKALMDALAVRPALCRGLLAAYLLGE